MWRFFKFILALPFIYIIILETLDFFYDDYRINNTIELNRGSYIIVFLVSIFVCQQFIYRISSEKDMLIKTIKSTAYAVFFGFIFIFYLYIIMPRTLFYINKAYARENVEDVFEVRYRYERDGELKFNFRTYPYNG